MPNRYDENRERFEGARGQGNPGDTERNWQNRSYEHNERSEWGNREWNNPGYRGRGEEGQSGSYGQGGGSQGGGNYRNEPYQGGREGRYGNQRQFEDMPRRFEERSNLGRGYEDRNYDDIGWERGYQSTPRNSGFNDDMRGADWDRSRGRSMTATYPRQDEWSQGHGVSAGLGGAENSEYANYPRSGSYYGGQGQFGGGLGQYGDQGGRHAGRGPKGYKRADERIREDVNERLTQDPHIDAGEIEVEVKNGEVTLTGTVDSRQTKRRAEDIIENLSGVTEVHNQLRVQSDRGANGGSAGNQGGTHTGASAGKQSSQNAKP